MCLMATLLMIAGTVGAGLRFEAICRRLNGHCLDANDCPVADPCQVKAALAQDQGRAEALKKQNLFAPAPPRSHPVGQVSGILGNEVLIQGKWYKVGDKIQDAEIIAIESTLVRILWDGNETEFKPITSSGGGGGPEGGPPRPDGPGPMRRAMPEGGFRGPPISPEDMERLKNMSPEERQAFMRERMQGRSP
jgi:hypothetical protein